MKCITELSTKIHRPGHPEDSVQSSGPPLECTSAPAEDDHEQHEKFEAKKPQQDSSMERNAHFTALPKEGTK